MPAIFAHDLFGRKVFSELDQEIKQMIRKEKDCFYLGLQGPDVLFFYRPLAKNPINQKGYRYHERPAMEIFAHGLQVMRQMEDEKERNAIQAYLLGMSCHFALDHSLHGTVNRLEKETGFTHAQIETELDRRLLQREEMEPVRAYTACHLKNTEITRLAVMHVLKEEEHAVKEAIFSFKTITRIFINSGEVFKKLIGVIMKAAGCHDKYYGMVMKQKPETGLKESTDKLEKQFMETVPFCVRLIEGLYDSMKKREALPSAFGGNFDGEN